MYTFLLQDWVTIRSASNITTINQSASGWLDLSGFQEIVGWIDVKGTTPGGGTISVVFQSAPTQDEALMTALVSNLSENGLIPISPGVTVASMLLNGVVNPPPSMSRWLRWLLFNQSPTATWDVTFRMFISANAGGGRRKSLGGVATAPSMRAGVPPSPGTPGSIRTRSGSSASGGGSGGGTTGGSSSAGASSSGVPYVHTPPSTPLHLQSSPGSGYPGGSGGSVPRVTPGSSGAHGPVRPTGPSVPLHRKPRGPTR